MLSTRGLGPAGAFAVRFQPGLLVPCTATAASFSTSTRPAKLQRPQHPTFKPQNRFPGRTSVRFESAAASSPQSPQTQLSWNDFFALRRTRRRIGQVVSGASAVTVTYFGLNAIIGQGYDATLAATLGLDPLMVMGLSTISMLAAGWLIGPAFGNQVFNLAYKGVLAEFNRKESTFFSRIKHHRVDPTSSSIANPVPDYYGEKIGSVADYRRWLKDQRAFNLKRGAYKGSK